MAKYNKADGTVKGAGSGTSGALTGNAKGSKRIGSIPTGAGGVASTGNRAPKSVGWPGEMDSRPENADRVQSAD